MSENKILFCFTFFHFFSHCFSSSFLFSFNSSLAYFAVLVNVFNLLTQTTITCSTLSVGDRVSSLINSQNWPNQNIVERMRATELIMFADRRNYIGSDRLCYLA